MAAIRISLLLAFALVAAACSDVAGLAADPIVVTVEVATNDTARLPALDEALRRRFARFDGAFASMEGERRGNTLVYTFRRLRMARDVFERIVTTRGELRVHLHGKPFELWYTDADVVDAVAMRDEQGDGIRLTLGEAAGRRVARLSERAMGQRVDFVWDGKVVLSPVVNGVMAREVQVTGIEDVDVRRMASFLRSGRLPVEVVEYRIESAQYE